MKSLLLPLTHYFLYKKKIKITSRLTYSPSTSPPPPLSLPSFFPYRIKAKKIEIQQTTPEALGVDVTTRVETVEVNEPPQRAAGVKVKEVADVVNKMKAAGVI